MGHFVREWKHFVLTTLFITMSCLSTSVQAVAAASEWPLGLPDEYTTAWLNITYKSRNGSLVTEKSQSGRYGKGGKVASVSGVVVHIKSSKNGTINHFGCEPIISEIPNEDWIALVRRGMCDFDLKLEHAYAMKAVGMIVYDREESDTLEDMKLSATYPIPGVFTYKSRGERIANISDGGTRVEMHIMVGEVCSRPYSSINRTSVLFVSISFIVLMIISLAWLVFYYVQRFRYLHAKDRLARLCNAAKKALAKIPTRNIKQTDKEVSGEGECCAVCIEFYKPGDMLRTLPCRHEFHKCCVDPWLLEHRTCPMCKMDILKYYGFIFTGSQESILHLDLEDGGLNSSDSRETDSPSHDNHVLSHHHHQVHHATTQHIESLSVSVSPEESGMPSFPQNEETMVKPSLISLAMVATAADGCVTAKSNPPPHVVDPNDASDGLIVALSKDDDYDDGGCNSSVLLPAVGINEASLEENEHPMCQAYKETTNPQIDNPLKPDSPSGNISQKLIPSPSASHQDLSSPSSSPAQATKSSIDCRRESCPPRKSQSEDKIPSLSSPVQSHSHSSNVLNEHYEQMQKSDFVPSTQQTD